jgi:hypothetical protein
LPSAASRSGPLTRATIEDVPGWDDAISVSSGALTIVMVAWSETNTVLPDTTTPTGLPSPVSSSRSVAVPDAGS